MSLLIRKMAGNSFLLIIIILFYLMLHQSAEEANGIQPICPLSFDCKDLGSFNFPFYNTTSTRCGLCKLNCNEQVPKVQLGEQGQWYNLEGTLQPGTILIGDQLLQNHLANQSCDSFDAYALPNSPSLSFIISANLTLFKCSNRPNLSLGPDKYFHDQGGYYSYKSCKEHSLYYRYPDYHRSSPDNLPPNCSFIQLPVLLPNMISNSTNATELFSILTAHFSVEVHVSDDCVKCHSKGGECQIGSRERFGCSKAKKETHGLWIKVAIATGATGIGLLVTIGLCLKRKQTENYQNVETFLKNYGSIAPKRYSYSDVKKMTNSFKFKIGQGGYGCVYKGKLLNDSLVAVKVLNESKGSDDEFINEVASITRTSHVNIVTLLGFCFEGGKRALIYEFMPNGSLEKFIYEGSSLTDHRLGWEKLYQIAIGIARGLEYLHRGCNMRILHFDIKPHNILLDKDLCPKISDFGLAKLCPGKDSVVSMKGMRGTLGYIAPELFSRNFGNVSPKSDVYSYGMMVLEMVGGRKNVVVGANRPSEIYFPHWIYKRVELDEEIGFHGITNEEEKGIVRKMIIASLWCIQTNPASRPSMNRVVDMLEGSLESLQVPPKPFLSSPLRSPADSPTKGRSNISRSPTD